MFYCFLFLALALLGLVLLLVAGVGLVVILLFILVFILVVILLFVVVILFLVLVLAILFLLLFCAGLVGTRLRLSIAVGLFSLWLPCLVVLGLWLLALGLLLSLLLRFLPLLAWARRLGLGLFLVLSPGRSLLLQVLAISDMNVTGMPLGEDDDVPETT